MTSFDKATRSSTELIDVPSLFSRLAGRIWIGERFSGIGVARILTDPPARRGGADGPAECCRG